MSLPVVTVASGGLPVVELAAGKLALPVSEATNGRGIPVTKVTGKPGLAVVFNAIGLTQTAPAAPLLVSVEVTSTSPAPTRITMTFDQSLDTGSVPATNAFLVVRNFVGRNPQSVTVIGLTCNVTLDADYGDPSGGTISYTPGTLKGANGIAVAAFSDHPIAP